MESFSTLFAMKTQAKVPPFRPLCSMILKHVHLGCDCCGNVPRIPVHQFLHRPTSVSHCMCVFLYIYWTNSTDCVLTEWSYLCCFSCSVGVVAPGKQLKGSAELLSGWPMSQTIMALCSPSPCQRTLWTGQCSAVHANKGSL